MAQDRKIIMRTSVFPTAQSTIPAVPASLEEYNITKSSYNKNKVTTSIGKLGGNSVMTDITSNQWGDAWTSFTSSNWDNAGDIWQNISVSWDGKKPMPTTQSQFSTDSSDLQYCYIKNIGSNPIIISLDGNSTYPLKLSANASTMFRGYSTNLKINEVNVKTTTSTSTIEYLIAK